MEENGTMKKNIGVSSICYSSFPLEDTLSKLTPVFSSIEIVDGGLHSLTGDNIEVIKSYDSHYSIHSPVSDVNIGSIFEPTRRASIEVLESRFKIASELDAPIIIHPGHVSWESDRPLAQQQLTKSISELIHLREEYGVQFYIENLLNWHSSLVKTPKDLDLLGEAPLALDIGHAHTCGCLAEFLEAPCEYYHIHDNNGIEDQHLSLGKGTIDLERLISALGRDTEARMILEMNAYQDAIESNNFLLEVLT